MIGKVIMYNFKQKGKRNMRTETTTRTLYTFDELSEEAKGKAIEGLYDLNVFFDWWDGVYEDAKEIGLKIESFDLGRHQIEGRFTQSAEDVAQAIIKDHGPDCETFKTATKFLKDLEGSRRAWAIMNPDEVDNEPDTDEELEKEFLQSLLEDYRIMLRQEYEYLTSDEAIIESIKANEYEFTEDGKLR